MKFVHCVKARVLDCQDICGDLKNKIVLDIGCNDGSLLSIFAEFGSKTYGIEPTDAAKDALSKNEHTIINDFFSEESAEKWVNRWDYFDDPKSVENEGIIYEEE